MEIISTKIEKDTKEKMRKFSYINWSEVIRESIRARIEEEESRTRAIDRNKIKEAMNIAASVRKPSKGWNSTEENRKWRDRVS
ncbi:MAG: VapB-type antitoxin [Candidatus Thermoplasmatota archaeon]|nr:VapB-type antitoxin [Candidatus Thermoplasmatota archaeon]